MYRPSHHLGSPSPPLEYYSGSRSPPLEQCGRHWGTLRPPDLSASRADRQSDLARWSDSYDYEYDDDHDYCDYDC